MAGDAECFWVEPEVQREFLAFTNALAPEKEDMAAHSPDIEVLNTSTWVEKFDANNTSAHHWFMFVIAGNRLIGQPRSVGWITGIKGQRHH